MDDAEVTRQAIGIFLSSWSQMETNKKKATSDADILQSYIELCPFVQNDSPALKAALETLKKAPKTKRSTTRINAKEPTPEAIRVATRITISSWSRLLVQSETLQDFEIVKRYLVQCPFVSSNSEVTTFVLDGLQKASTRAPPPLHGMECESDSEESVKGRKTNQDVGPSQKKEKSKRSTSPNKKQKKTKFSPILFLVRSILLDFPMALLFATYVGLMWVHRVDQLYIIPSMKAAEWTEERAEQEITYYNRHCTGRDVTAKKADDLFVPNNASIQKAYEHQLRNGFSIFQGVLTEDAMYDLRSYVVSRNRNLTAEESIFVIAGENRFSFGLGTDVPSVAKAVKQLATHSKLAPTLEKVLGPNPALIEMTAITSSYGAVSQYWHDDVIAPASAMKYGRSFGPSYSVFIQLQNTTKAMGATSACPGSHKCGDGKIDEFCERGGFQAVDSRTGYWKAGDALLMNMNSYHRGFAHTDPNAPDRVMLILTFVPKPQERAESRQLSQGITFSLRWDMWGHTLWDLARADTHMTQPWATLRSLGLYKPKDAVWGVDYVSSGLCRISNEDNGFRRDELDTFVERGGFQFLPQFLHGQVTDETNWHDFLLDTLTRCIEFLGCINVLVLFLYGFVLVLMFALLPEDFGSRGVRKSMLRSALVYGLVFVIWRAADSHVDNTGWAKDIRAGRRYSVDWAAEEVLNPTLEHLPSTLPFRKDVLIETRYGSRQFHMYNDFTNDHPGNRSFQRLVRKYAFAFNQVTSDLFRDATASYLVSWVYQMQGRFLFQRGIEWLWLSDKDAIDFAKAELVVETNPLLRRMRQEIRFLESEYKYGVHRGTALASTSLEILENKKNRLLRDAIFTAAEGVTGEAVVSGAGVIKFALLRQKLWIPHTIRTLPHPIPDRHIVGIAPKRKEPRYGAWLKSGDIIEGTEFLDDGEAHWYKGVLERVTASGDFFAKYDDDSFGILDDNLIRAYKPYSVGEELEVLMEDEEGAVELCTVVETNEDGTFDVFLAEDEELVKQVPTGDLRRLREDEILEKQKVRNHYA